MKSTQILIITHRAPHEGTKQCLAATMRAGAKANMASGYADIANGRSVEITRMMDRMVELWAPTVGVLLCADDDMEWDVKDAETLVNYTRETGRPASAVYGGSNGRVVTNRHDGCHWELGLGFFTVRLDHLLRVAAKLPRVRCTSYDAGAIPFSCSGIHPSIPDRYTGEDFWLCRELGGVDLLPVAVGHFKSIALYPDEVTIERIRKGEDLPGEVEERQKQGRRLALHDQATRAAIELREGSRLGSYAGMYSHAVHLQQTDPNNPELVKLIETLTAAGCWP